MRLGMFQRKTVWLPTWRGWAAFGVAALVFLGIILGELYPFLAVNQPVAADILVVESWVPDEILDQVIQEYRKGHYHMLLATGCPIENGKYTLPYRTYPEMTLAALIKLGIPESEAKAVSAEKTPKDRTYHSGLALRAWMAEHNIHPASINIATHSCHARRTRLMFEKAFDGQLAVGIISFEGADFNAGNWWRCSAGVRETVGEIIAYVYARILFNPAKY